VGLRGDTGGPAGTLCVPGLVDVLLEGSALSDYALEYTVPLPPAVTQEA
jgi:hypothetical protein